MGFNKKSAYNKRSKGNKGMLIYQILDKTSQTSDIR